MLRWFLSDETAAFLAEGGLEVLTPTPRSQHDQVSFRTSVDIDGDVVTFIHADHINDEPGLRQHFAFVDTALKSVTSEFRRLLACIASGAGVCVWGATAGGAHYYGFAPDEAALSGVVASALMLAVGYLIARFSESARSSAARFILRYAARRAGAASLKALRLDGEAAGLEPGQLF